MDPRSHTGIVSSLLLIVLGSWMYVFTDGTQAIVGVGLGILGLALLIIDRFL